MARLKQTNLYWGPVSGVEQADGQFLRFLTPGDGSFLVHPSLSKLRPPGPTLQSPYQKAIRWVRLNGENVAVGVESRAADCVPWDFDLRVFYLIRRTDSGLLAMPGGFIDAADRHGPKESDWIVASRAASRELDEETGGFADSISTLFFPTLEAIAEGSSSTTRENVTITYPFAASMPMTLLHPADDAQQAPGDGDLLPGWYHFESLPAVVGQLHFQHHAVILARLGELRRGRPGNVGPSVPTMIRKRFTSQRTYYLQIVMEDLRNLMIGRHALLLSDTAAAAIAAKNDAYARALLGHQV